MTDQRPLDPTSDDRGSSRMTEQSHHPAGAVTRGTDGSGALERHTDDRFDNPGLPPHVLRNSDRDEKAAKRAEKQVATMFGLSMLATLGFLVTYFVVDEKANVFLPFVGKASLLNTLLGVTLGISLLMIGLGAVHWAKTLMSDHEVVEERHPIATDAAGRTKAIGIVSEGVESTQLNRRPLLKMSLGGALGLFALPLGLQVAGSLDPKRHNAPEDLRETIWETKFNNGKPVRLVRDPELTPIKLSEVSNGAVFHVLPETIKPIMDSRHGIIEAKAKAVVILIRLEESKITSQKQKDWGIDGVVAYSKICTHVGCPVGLYEQQTHHLLCPCHQSTFDLTNDCNVIFGPAKRPLPQLKIEVDDQGYLVSKDGFGGKTVGPSFWEMEK